MPKPGVVDNAVYVDGYRVDSPPTLEQTYDLQKRRDGLAWIGLYRPSDTMIQSVAHEFDLHHLMVEDAIVAAPATQAGALRHHACSPCSARLATSTTRRRSSSASCT